MKNFIEEMRWRGLVQDITPGTEEQLIKESTTGYVGFDPTADSLHIGNLVPVMLLVHFQRCGHRPIALVGGATGMVGDPSGKSEERNMLSEEILQKNLAGQRKQLEKFLDFDTNENPAKLVNNYDWYKGMGVLNFLRDIGKHLTVNYMMAKDSVKKRLETGLSFTEFSYQLIQGYDFFHLNKTENCKLQMGGSDQWGNITTGTEVIRRMGGGDAFALTAPLLTKADGNKFGKSEQGNIWLDRDKTSPYRFYQYWLNVSDEDAPRLLRIFTLMGQDEIVQLEEQHTDAPHLRIMQKALASDVTTMVHSAEDTQTAIEASQILFSKDATDTLGRIDEATFLDIFDGVPTVSISRAQLDSATEVIELLSDTTANEIFKSKGEARRMIQAGAVSINKQKVVDGSQKPAYDLLNGKYLLVQRGKKNWNIILVE